MEECSYMFVSIKTPTKTLSFVLTQPKIVTWFTSGREWLAIDKRALDTQIDSEDQHFYHNLSPLTIHRTLKHHEALYYNHPRVFLMKYSRRNTNAVLEIDI